MPPFRPLRQSLHTPSPLKKQRGVTLLVALVLLLIMSMIAVTSLNTSTLEEKMAVNTQNQISVFQGAESGIDKAINDLDVLKTVAYSESSRDINVEFSSKSKISSTVTVNFKRIDESTTDSGRTPSATEIGVSWGEGTGGPVLPVVYYEAKGSAKIKSNEDINTVIRQGFKYSLGER